MTLDDWALATITGADSEKYMQGQVTADVSQMTEDQHLLAAHCDAKGKMWSNLRLFRGTAMALHGLNGAACVNRSD